MNTVSFVLNSCPPTFNGGHIINYKQKEVKTKKEVSDWQNEAKKVMPHFELAYDQSVVRVDRLYHFPWKWPKGSWIIRDAFNMDFFLFNAIAKRYGFNDLRIKGGWCWSYDSDVEKTEITVTEVMIKDGVIYTCCNFG